MRKEGKMPKFKSAEFAAQMAADGIVEGYAATFDREPDSYGDVIAKGAFARTPRDVFDVAEDSRATTGGTAFATAVAGWAALESIRQCAPRRGATKTWDVTSSNPRPSHAAMNGETVPYVERFSNGAMWPGDTDALDAEEVANCQCTVTIEIP